MDDGEPLAAFEEETVVVNVTVICTLKFPSGLCHTFLSFLSYYWETTSPSFEQSYVPNFQMYQWSLLRSGYLDGIRSTNDYIEKLTPLKDKNVRREDDEAGEALDSVQN